MRTILDPAAVGHARSRIDRAISSSARGLARRGVRVAAERDVLIIAVEPALRGARGVAELERPGTR
ncbi:MAG: hypothetical protein KF817_10725 [Phycisphaeraceae bacterium]|nr:hypothetical protein [Phycisphaeraceae bacterium]